MFKCEVCSRTQPPGAKPVMVVVERRDREYRNAKGEVVGTGWEIVREERRCVECKEAV